MELREGGEGGRGILEKWFRGCPKAIKRTTLVPNIPYSKDHLRPGSIFPDRKLAKGERERERFQKMYRNSKGKKKHVEIHLPSQDSQQHFFINCPICLSAPECKE